MRFIYCSLVVLSSFGAQAQARKEYHDAKQTQLKSETNYFKGFPYGEHKEYYKNGKLSCVGFYYAGKQSHFLGKEDSVWTYYYEDGTKKAVEHYDKGLKNGTNLYYYKSGKR